jgi:hypothetical protein
MRIISFIYQRVVIEKILVHLGFFRTDPSERALPGPSSSNGHKPIVYEHFDDNWPGYGESAYVA